MTRIRRNRHLDWELVIVDDASPDGTLEVAQQLQTVYGAERIVSRLLLFHAVVLIPLSPRQILKPRTGKLGLGCVALEPVLCCR